MEPFVALMRRYVVEYTNRHDTAVCAQIMAPGYTLRMGAHVLRGRDEHYVPAAAAQFRQFPGLGLTVHEIVTNGSELALRFSEHGASIRHGGRRAAWSGIGLYRWDGTRLLENFVEQDYLSRRRQLAGGGPIPVPAPATAPWDERARPANPRAEAAVRAWIADGMPGGTVRRDDGTAGPRLRDANSTIDVLFSAGEAVAFRVTQVGAYDGGLPETGAERGAREVRFHVVGLVHTEGDRVRGGHLVGNRLDVVRELERPADLPLPAGEPA
ncbi:ester cyclase [Nocardia harenae]|uniref:ester cyclase n=1 Tax=Nocardia harenae TaxID=358707 RepID=UPI0008366823|nr:ester cyclase [Nocardia harenae]